jgi:hypothetical protein
LFDVHLYYLLKVIGMPITIIKAIMKKLNGLQDILVNLTDYFHIANNYSATAKKSKQVSLETEI